MRPSEAVLHIADEPEAASDAALAALLADKAGAIDALAQALRAPMPKKRLVKSARLLAAFGGVDGVPALLAALDRGSLDLDERAAIATALSELVDARHAGDARVRRHAVALSKELLASVRASAIPILVAVADADAEARLAAMAAGDNDLGMRARAADALALLRAHRQASADGQGVLSPFSADDPTPPSATAPGDTIDFAALIAGGSTPDGDVPPGGLAVDFEALVQQQAAAPAAAPLDAREALIRRLADPRWSERHSAIEAVVARGADMVPVLIEHLGPNVAARMGICLALARMQAPEAASALLMLATSEAVTSDQRDVQAVALKALANSLTGTEEGVATLLLPLLKSPDPFVRSGAIVCLGRLADRVGARAATLMLATDTNLEVRKAAAIAISESVREDHTDLVAPMLATLNGLPSPPPEGIEAILIALTRIDLVDVALRSRVRHRVRRLVFGYTAAQRRLAMTVLDRCYDENDPPPVWVVEDVLTRTADGAPDVRLIAASFIARFLPAGLTDAVRRLEDALERGERGVSLLCCDALRRHDTPLARSALEATAQSDADEQVRTHATSLLEGFAPGTTEWVPTVPPAAEASSPSSPPIASSSSSVSSAASPISEGLTTPTAQIPRRVRAAASDADVVMAKDANDGDGTDADDTPAGA